MVFRNALIIIFSSTSMLTLVHGRPEADLPYHYPQPSNDQNDFAAKSRNFGQTSGQQYIPPNFNNGKQQQQQQQRQSNDAAIPRTSYGTPFSRSTQNNAVSPNSLYGTPGEFRNQPESTVSIQKHVYVHVAPPEEEEPPRQRIQQQVPRQKHYKIIFVKAPSYPAPAPYVAQQPPQQEEKTLVYVLVKKPDELEPPRIEQAAKAPINKPEVYFIRYKAKKSEQAGQDVPQHTEGVQENEIDDTVVVESPFRSANTKNQGYNYDRP